MAVWQVVVLVVMVLLPLLLLIRLHPSRERLDARGVPMVRDWRPTPSPPPPADDHH